MTNCIFCKIIKKEIPSLIVYEDKNTLAFLDINPASKGHTLVIPKAHAKTIDKLKEGDAKSLITSVQKIAKSILSFNEGCNVMQNNNLIAGQVVDHVHFHIVPRNKNDGLHTGFGRHVEYKDDKEKEDTIKKIKKNIS